MCMRTRAHVVLCMRGPVHTGVKTCVRATVHYCGHAHAHHAHVPVHAHVHVHVHVLVHVFICVSVCASAKA